MSNYKQSGAARRLLAMALGLIIGIFAVPASAENLASKSARAWLERLETALEQTDYRGVFVYARGSEVNSMRIVHRYHEGVVTERLTQLDGDNGEIIRRGSEIICTLPNRGRLELDAIIPAGPFAGAFTDRLKPMSRWYQPKRLEDGRIAGFDTVVIAVTAKDQHRYSYRLWLEEETGLLLKSQVRNGQDEVLERFQFTQLEIVDHIAESEFDISATAPLQSLAANATPTPTPTEPPPVQTNDIGPRPWELGWTPDGFVAFADSGGDRGHLTAFSDGMASYSVFVEPMGDMDMPEGASRIGATTAYLHKVEAEGTTFLVTVVGEIPPATAMQVAQSVSFEEDEDGESSD